MKTCACCASASPDDALSCIHCGEGSWLAKAQPPAVLTPPEEPPATDGAEDADGDDDAEEPAGLPAPGAAAWARSPRRRKRVAPN